eukprot:811893-Prorocentrum_minimum.AAC.3
MALASTRPGIQKLEYSSATLKLRLANRVDTYRTALSTSPDSSLQRLRSHQLLTAFAVNVLSCLTLVTVPRCHGMLNSWRLGDLVETPSARWRWRRWRI